MGFTRRRHKWIDGYLKNISPWINIHFLDEDFSSFWQTGKEPCQVPHSVCGVVDACTVVNCISHFPQKVQFFMKYRAFVIIFFQIRLKKAEYQVPIKLLAFYIVAIG